MHMKSRINSQFLLTCIAAVSCSGDRPDFANGTMGSVDQMANDTDGGKSGHESERDDGTTESDAASTHGPGEHTGPGNTTSGPYAVPSGTTTAGPSSTEDGTDTDCNECTSGQTLCAGGEVKTCTQVAGCWTWSAATPCAEGSCKDDVECAVCSDACALDTTKCSDGKLQTCGEGADGCSSWLAPEPCATDQCADESTCFECDDQCAMGQARCTDGQLSRCEQDAMGCFNWGAGLACDTGACTTATACTECDDECSVGDATCTDGGSSECVADEQGCLVWSAPKACSSGTCSSETECLVCNDECPSVDAGSCNGRQLQTCVADANGCLAWSTPTTCDYVCDSDSGACAGACTPNEKGCDDQQPQVCNADGEWEASGVACGGCTSCSADSGSCVAMTGTSCDDDNECTTGEKCQANGSCGGGSSVECDGADQCHTVAACIPATGCPAPVVKSGSCDDDNACLTGESCQSNGMCGGGTPASNTTSCGTNQYCDGSGGCGCRTKSSWNKLANPGFNGSTDSWILNGGATYQANEDVDQCSGSGSILINALAASVTQCVTAQPTTDYYFGFRFKSSGGAGSAGTAVCNIFFAPVGTACTDTVGSGASATQSFNTNNWIQGSGVATSDSDSAVVRINCVGPAAAGYYDQIYLSTSSPGVPAF